MPRESADDKPENHDCENCGKHRASIWWVGDEGTLAASRYYMQRPWCKCCALKAQVGHARKMARKLAGLEKKLAKAKCKPKVV